MVLTTALFCAVPFFDPIAQWPEYHDFADQRAWLGIANAVNVLSNLPFVLVGAMGLAVWARRKRTDPSDWRDSPGGRAILLSLFTGIFLTGWGSAYYHWNPVNATLVWDRSPLALAIMSLVAAVIADRVSLRAGVAWLGPLVLFGIGSVVGWYASEVRGAGDLRWYAITQFYPLMLIPLLAILFPARMLRTRDLFITLSWYVLAKALEAADDVIFSLGGVVSGHTLKHLAAGAGTGWILRLTQRSVA